MNQGHLWVDDFPFPKDKLVSWRVDVDLEEFCWEFWKKFLVCDKIGLWTLGYRCRKCHNAPVMWILSVLCQCYGGTLRAPGERQWTKREIEIQNSLNKLGWSNSTHQLPVSVPLREIDPGSCIANRGLLLVDAGKPQLFPVFWAFRWCLELVKIGEGNTHFFHRRCIKIAVVTSFG